MLNEAFATPKQIIKALNAKTQNNVNNNDKNRKKISNLRYKLNQSSKDSNYKPLFSIQQINTYIEEHTLNQLEIHSLDENVAFVIGSIIKKKTT